MCDIRHHEVEKRVRIRVRVRVGIRVSVRVRCDESVEEYHFCTWCVCVCVRACVDVVGRLTDR